MKKKKSEVRSNGPKINLVTCGDRTRRLTRNYAEVVPTVLPAYQLQAREVCKGTPRLWPSAQPQGGNSFAIGSKVTSVASPAVVSLTFQVTVRNSLCMYTAVSDAGPGVFGLRRWPGKFP